MGHAGLSNPACLVSSPKQEFRLLRCPSPNAQCETWLEHLRCGMVALGLLVWALPGHLFSACSPWETWHFNLTREPQRCGDARAGRRSLWEGKPVLILILEIQNLPLCKMSRYDIHHCIDTGKTILCQHYPVWGCNWDQEPNCAVKMASGRVCICLYLFISVFSSHLVFFRHISLSLIIPVL